MSGTPTDLSAPVAPDRRPRRWVEQDPVPVQDLRLLPIAVGLWLGTAVALALPLPRPAAMVSGVAMSLGGSVAVCLVRGTRLRGFLVWIVGCAAGIVIGSAAVLSALQDPATAAAQAHRYVVADLEITGAPVALKGFVGEGGSPSTAPRQYRIAARAVTIRVGTHVDTSAVSVSVLGTGDAFANLVPGTRIGVGGLVEPDDFPVVPGVSLRARTPPTQIDAPPVFQAVAAQWRAGLRDRGEQIGGDAGALLPGLVVGDTSAVDDRLSADAKTTGLTHLLAVSGSHFALVCGFVVALTRRFGPRASATAAAAVLLGMVVLVGGQPSVLRAAVMGAVTIAAMVMGRNRSAVPALATAVIALLLVDPSLALSAGFGLSVAATAGLVMLVAPWTKGLIARGWPRGWATLIAVPVAASVVTAPIIVLLSGAISLVSIPANILAAPLVAPPLVLGLLSALCAPWWPSGADGLAGASAPFLAGIAWIAHHLAAVPQAAVGWPPGVMWALLLAGLTVATGLVLRFPGPRAVALAAVTGLGVVLLPLQVLPPVGWPAAGWLITGCEVGQGDAFALSTNVPDTAVVVDTGPEPGPVDSCLGDLRIGTVSLLLITHLHADHVGGLSGVLDGRSVGIILVGPDRTEPAWSTLQSAAAAAGIPVVAVQPGNRFSAGDLTLSVLAPFGPFSGTESDENNDSLVVRAERLGVSMLLTGDIEPPAQQKLLASGAVLHADILKVPHHGSSRDLPAFLAAVAPRVAMIGVGRDNAYGHPAPSLLAALSTAEVASVLRTDEDGDVAVVLDGGGLQEVRRGVIRAREPAAHPGSG